MADVVQADLRQPDLLAQAAESVGELEVVLRRGVEEAAELGGRRSMALTVWRSVLGDQVGPNTST